MERLDDASTELMMGNDGDKVMLFMGNAFFETNEEVATQHCENLVEKYQNKIDTLTQEETTIVEQQSILKKELYSRFGKSINLEESPQE